MIERDAFVGEVSNHHTLFARAVVIGGVDSHACARGARFAERNAGHHGVVRKRSVVVVAIELVWLRVVCDEEIEPAVAVVIEQCDAERLVGGIVKTGERGDVFERAVAAIVIERRTLAFVSLRSAVRFVFVVERAVLVRLRRPLDIVADKQIELAVVIVIEPRRTR